MSSAVERVHRPRMPLVHCSPASPHRIDTMPRRPRSKHESGTQVCTLGAIWITRLEAHDEEGLERFLTHLPPDIAQGVRELARSENRGRSDMRYAEKRQYAYLLHHSA